MYKDVEKVKVVWSDWKTYERMPCEVYTRVMWYIRNVNNFNLAKKSEFFGRKNFDMAAASNSEFIRKYSN